MNSIQLNFILLKDLSPLTSLFSLWRNSLTAPQDDMWDSFIFQSNVYGILLNDTYIGFASVNSENQLLQFFVSDKTINTRNTIFKHFITTYSIKDGFVGTNNPCFLSVSLYFQKQIKIHTYLFTEKENTCLSAYNNKPILATQKEIDSLITYCHEQTTAPMDWLKLYVTSLVEKNEFFIVRNKKELLGTFEVRKCKNNPSIAHLGVIVSTPFRGKGIGTQLLSMATTQAIEWNKTPICSCEAENIASLKAIEKNGFRSKHQILHIYF